MALVKATLASAIQALSESPPGIGAPDPALVQANAWGDAIGAYFATITPPSATVAAATTTIKAALHSAFSTVGGAGAGMESAFAAFGATVGAGMAPAFVAVPPAAPVGFAAFFARDPDGDAAQAAADIADLIDAWAKTGTATPSGGGPPVPWS